MGEKLVEEHIQSQIKQFTMKIKGDKKTKNRRCEPGNRVSSSRSNISRAMRGRIPKIPNFLTLRNQRQEEIAASNSEMTILPHPASSSAPTTFTTQAKRSSDRSRRSPSYYGFNISSSDSTIAAPPKRPSRAGNVENFQSPTASVVETVQNIAVQQPEDIKISLIIGEVSPRSMMVFEAENQEMSEELILQTQQHKL